MKLKLLKFKFKSKMMGLIGLMSIVTIMLKISYHYVSYPILPKSNHYNPDKQQFFNTPESQPVKGGLKTIGIWLSETLSPPENRFPPTLLPSVKPDFQQFLSKNHQFIWFGHSTLMMRLNNQTFLIDPVFSNYAAPIPLFAKRFQNPPASLHELPPIDWIVLSHNHYDHLDKDTIKFFVDKLETKFIVPLNLGVLLQDWGIDKNRIVELDWWQDFDFKWIKNNQDNLKIYAVPARHDSMRGIGDKNKTLWAGWVFTDNIKKIYYTGDSAYGDGRYYREIGQYFGQFDLSFIENGQYNELWSDNHMFPAQTVQAAMDTHSQKVVPVHWGMFALSRHAWDESVRESMPLFRKNNIQTVTPILGQVFDMDTPTEFWWENIK